VPTTPSLVSVNPWFNPINPAADHPVTNSFEITGPNSDHICLVHEALGMSLEDVRDLVPNREFAADLVRQTLRDVLRVLHFYAKKLISSTQVYNFISTPYSALTFLTSKQQTYSH
jgi:hypothetical protein